MIALTITDAEAGQRLNKYLMKYLNQAPSSFIYKMLRKKNITLNGKKALGDEIIAIHDEIKLFLSDETIEKMRSTQETHVASNSSIKLQVLYEDNNILAVHKPVGILSQKANKDDISINEEILAYYSKNKKTDDKSNITFKPSVCNRIDRNTSGIILAGISLKGSQYLSKVLKDRNCDKYYYTIIKGNITKSIHSIAYITKDVSTNRSEIISTPMEGYTKIETEFIPIEFSEGYSFIKVKLITGKSHQIRAHLKYLGYPMIGDHKYGNPAVNQQLKKAYGLKNQLLHAGEIHFHKDTYWKEDMIITDPLPEQFDTIKKALGFQSTIGR